MSENFCKLDGENGFAVQHCMYILNVANAAKIDPQSSYKNFYCHQQCRGIPISTHPHQCLMMVKFYIIFFVILCVNMISAMAWESFIGNVFVFLFPALYLDSLLQDIGLHILCSVTCCLYLKGVQIPKYSALYFL